MPHDYISTKEAAHLLGYTVQHTRLLIREGRLQAEKFGRDWLVAREAVAQYNAGIQPDMQSESAGQKMILQQEAQPPSEGFSDIPQPEEVQDK